MHRERKTFFEATQHSGPRFCDVYANCSVAVICSTNQGHSMLCQSTGLCPIDKGGKFAATIFSLSRRCISLDSDQHVPVYAEP